MSDEKTYTITLTADQLQKVISALDYMATRHWYLANMAHRQGRDREVIARKEIAAGITALAEKLEAIAAGGGK